MKVEEGEALQTSKLLHRLTSLTYVWFEAWSWEGEQEANFLAVLLANLAVFGRLQEVRFPGTLHIPFRCLRGLLAATPKVQQLALPPLSPGLLPDSPQHRSAVGAMAALSCLTDLCLEGWQLGDADARALGQGLPLLARAVLGSTGALTLRGYESLAQLTGLCSLTLSGATGSNATLLPLTALTRLTGLRVELAAGFGDSDAGPLALQPQLRTLGWWHAEAQPGGGLHPGSLGSTLRELSLCMDLDTRALGVLAGCRSLSMIQVQTITIPLATATTPLLEAAGARIATALGMRLPSAGGAAAAAPAAAPAPAGAGPGGAAEAPGGAQGAAGGSEPTAAAKRRRTEAGRAPGGGPPRPASLLLPVLPALRTLILGELYLPPPDEPQPVARLSDIFPGLENAMSFSVEGRGLLQLERTTSLRRLVLNAPQLKDAALGSLPPLPSLRGLQLEGCPLISDAAAAALRQLTSLEQLLLTDLNVSDAFLTEAATCLPRLRSLVLARLDHVTDEGLQALSTATALEKLELRAMRACSAEGLQVVHRLPRLNTVAVCACARVDKDACRSLTCALAEAGREDATVEHESTQLLQTSLADEFEQPRQE
ncbi:hypothetical protein HYH03_004833 [Edaphochlamys debaryana]|uniref:Uncharacterized protein n=1 Tax=Edaphochlamys debaryana TaxID=47281 RepID=A0A835Y8U0_9CHLO|nr:hypothetical protein HYH03_004833 [Edaphochlamys debaryana]|eukprot:KAG2497249.1 hypothetical protein HYH03_004833 [Edaphochlamys debaryana]